MITPALKAYTEMVIVSLDHATSMAAHDLDNEDWAATSLRFSTARALLKEIIDGDRENSTYWIDTYMKETANS